jgi:hypothetical protein
MVFATTGYSINHSFADAERTRQFDAGVSPIEIHVAPRKGVSVKRQDSTFPADTLAFGLFFTAPIPPSPTKVLA